MTALPLQDKQDSSKLTSEQEDVAERIDVEGGYTITRPKHSRNPRRTFTTGFTELTDAQKGELEAFYQTMKGGSIAFEWTHPTTGVIYSVRFKESLKFSYVGHGETYRWNSGDITLEQV